MRSMRQFVTYAILEILDRDYNIHTAAMEAITETEMWQLKCHSDKDMSKYLDDMLNVRQKLAEYGRSIDDATFIRAISGSVPPAYRDVLQGMQTTLDTQNAASKAQLNVLNQAMANVTGFARLTHADKTLNVLEVVNKLRAKAATNLAIKNDGKSSKPKTEPVNSVQERGNRYQRGRGKGKFKSKRDNNNNRSGKGATSKMKCYNCNGYGHFANECATPSKRKNDKSNANQVKDETKSKDDRKDNTPSAKIEEVAAVESLPLSAWLAARAASNPDMGASIDSGSAYHLTGDRSRIHDLEPAKPIYLRSAFGEFIEASNAGRMEVPLDSQGNSVLKLRNVYYHPKIASTLISLSELDDEGYSYKGGNGEFSLYEPNGKYLGTVKKTQKQYTAYWSNSVTTTESKDWPKLSLYEIHDVEHRQSEVAARE